MDWLTELLERHDCEQREGEDEAVREMRREDAPVCWDDSSRDRWWQGLREQADEEVMG